MKTTSDFRFSAQQCGVSFLIAFAPLIVLAQGGQTPEIYTCIDAKGRKITSDRKIPACSDREQKVLNPSGTTKTTVGPTLTAQERIQLEAREKALQQERAHLEEEKRRDRALLMRYPDEQRHHKERTEALAQITLVKQAAMLRAAELHAEYVKLQEEMAFYAKDPKRAPTKLRHQFEAAKVALEGQDHFIADKDLESARTNARFDEELQRLRPLWRMNMPTGTRQPQP